MSECFFFKLCTSILLSIIVPQSEDIVLMTPEQFKKQYNIIAKTLHEVMKINTSSKSVTVKELTSGTEFEEKYDVLVLSLGASPLVPSSIKGTDKPYVFTVRNVADIKKIDDYIQAKNVKDIAVIGAGYIGMEVAENFKLAGKNVTLVEKLNQVVALLITIWLNSCIKNFMIKA